MPFDEVREKGHEVIEGLTLYMTAASPSAPANTGVSVNVALYVLPPYSTDITDV